MICSYWNTLKINKHTEMYPHPLFQCHLESKLYH